MAGSLGGLGECPSGKSGFVHLLISILVHSEHIGRMSARSAVGAEYMYTDNKAMHSDIFYSGNRAVFI